MFRREADRCLVGDIKGVFKVARGFVGKDESGQVAVTEREGARRCFSTILVVNEGKNKAY
ncbi:hypothetical protein P5745_32480 [Bacillus cereus]|uniref:hypothetical protein n=1 Tax=Bacillus cereus TaxID=1396 RepID=UPI002406D821|nr:hypothetical protein [Bacillus cereus]MDF9565248.1 hypothetical protein [Bacillus cereus]